MMKTITTRKIVITSNMMLLIVHTKDITIKLVTTNHTVNTPVTTRVPMTKMMMIKKIVTIRRMIPKIVRTKVITIKAVIINRIMPKIVTMIRAMDLMREYVTTNHMMPKIVRTKDITILNVATNHTIQKTVHIMTTTLVARIMIKKYISAMFLQATLVRPSLYQSV